MQASAGRHADLPGRERSQRGAAVCHDHRDGWPRRGSRWDRHVLHLYSQQNYNDTSYFQQLTLEAGSNGGWIVDRLNANGGSNSGPRSFALSSAGTTSRITLDLQPIGSARRSTGSARIRTGCWLPSIVPAPPRTNWRSNQDSPPAAAGTWTNWSTFTNPSDTIAGDPAVGENSDGRPYVFVRGASGTIYQSLQGGGTGGNYSTLAAVEPDDPDWIYDCRQSGSGTRQRQRQADGLRAGQRHPTVCRHAEHGGRDELGERSATSPTPPTAMRWSAIRQ